MLERKGLCAVQGAAAGRCTYNMGCCRVGPNEKWAKTGRGTGSAQATARRKHSLYRNCGQLSSGEVGWTRRLGVHLAHPREGFGGRSL